MSNFTLEKFNPTLNELKELAEKHNWLDINWIDDKEWYENVKEALKELRDKRVYITKTLKNYRQEAIDFQRAVLEHEKELIWIISNTEDSLKEKKQKIDKLILIKKTEEILPVRKWILDSAWIKYNDDDILEMDDKDFAKFMIEEKQKLIEEEEKRKQEEADKKQRESELEKAKQEAELKAKKEAEEKAKIEAELAEKKHKEEIDRIRKEQEEKEEAEKQKKLDEEKKAKEEKERVEKMEKYNKWKDENWYNEKDFMIQREWDIMVI